MAGTAIWSAEARADVKRIAEYIAREGRRPETALRLVDEIHDRVNLLATQPLMGEARPEFGQGCRLFSIRRWVVLYRPTDSGLDVLPFVDGARDYDRLFRLG